MWLFIRSVLQTGHFVKWPIGIYHIMFSRLCSIDKLSYYPMLFSLQSFSSPLKLLQQRTWLIHWSLFIFFNHPEGRDKLLEMFLNQAQ